MRRPHRKIWTPEEENLLRTLLENGRSVTIAAETLNRTRDCIKGAPAYFAYRASGKSGQRLKSILRDDRDDLRSVGTREQVVRCRSASFPTGDISKPNFLTSLRASAMITGRRESLDKVHGTRHFNVFRDNGEFQCR